MRTESDFSQAIRYQFSIYERIETRTKDGIPDVFYGIYDDDTHDTYTGWAELKYINKEKANQIERVKKICVPDFKKEQSFWLQSKFMKGVVTHLLVGVGDVIYGFRGGNLVVTSGSRFWGLSEFCNLADFVCRIAGIGKELRNQMHHEQILARTTKHFWEVRQRVI